jgi:hypothetical protein
MRTRLLLMVALTLTALPVLARPNGSADGHGLHNRPSPWASHASDSVMDCGTGTEFTTFASAEVSATSNGYQFHLGGLGDSGLLTASTMIDLRSQKWKSWLKGGDNEA